MAPPHVAPILDVGAGNAASSRQGESVENVCAKSMSTETRTILRQKPILSLPANANACREVAGLDFLAAMGIASASLASPIIPLATYIDGKVLNK